MCGLLDCAEYSRMYGIVMKLKKWSYHGTLCEGCILLFSTADKGHFVLSKCNFFSFIIIYSNNAYLLAQVSAASIPCSLPFVIVIKKIWFTWILHQYWVVFTVYCPMGTLCRVNVNVGVSVAVDINMKEPHVCAL